MHEFVVTLRNGLRFTIKAHRVVVADGYVALIDDGAVPAGSADSFAGRPSGSSTRRRSRSSSRRGI